MYWISTYRNSHQLLYVLDLVSRRRRPQTFELGLQLGLRQQPLLRGLLLRFLQTISRSSYHNFVVVSVVFIEKGRFIMDRARCDLHLEGMLLCCLLNFLQVFVVTVLREPADNVAVGPVNLQSVSMFVVDMIL